MNSSSPEKISIFVDVQNIYYTCRKTYARNFDYNKFWAKVTAGREVVSAFAYATERGDEKQQQFQNILEFPPLELIPASPFFSRALDRWLLAEVLRKSGRDRGDPALLEEALAWYETLSDGWGEFLLAAPAHFRQGEIQADLGNRVEAIAHYRRFEELWRNADYPLASLVQDARNAREGLESEGSG